MGAEYQTFSQADLALETPAGFKAHPRSAYAEFVLLALGRYTFQSVCSLSPEMYPLIFDSKKPSSLGGDTKGLLLTGRERAVWIANLFSLLGLFFLHADVPLQTLSMNNSA